MKQRAKMIVLLFLAAFITVSGLAGCVPDQSEYEYLFDYWLADWYGWYEITDATGKYAPLNGQKSGCIAMSTMTHRCTFHMDVYDPEGEWIFSFDGDYGHEPENEYGKVVFHRIELSDGYVGEIPQTKSERYDGIPVAFTVDGEDHGIAELAVCKGTAGEGEDTLTMELYLRHWGVRWEDLKTYTGDAFGERVYPACLPPDYDVYTTVFDREQVEQAWHREEYGWYGWYEITDTTGELTKYAAAKTVCEADISVDHYWEHRLRRNYNIVLTPLEAGERDSERSFSLYGPWRPDPENALGTILFERVRFADGGHTAQGIADAASHGVADMVVIQAQADTESGSMHITACLRPKGMSWNDLKGIHGEIIDGMTYEELLPPGMQE